MRYLILTGLFAAAAVAAYGCDDDDTIQETEDFFDCAAACDAWDDCIDDFDESDCVDRCDDNRDQGIVSDQRVENCNDCLNAWACQGPNPCEAECLGVTF